MPAAQKAPKQSPRKAASTKAAAKKPASKPASKKPTAKAQSAGTGAATTSATKRATKAPGTKRTSKAAARKHASKASASKASSRASRGARALREENERVIRRVTDSLETAQTELSKLRGNLGDGVGDLRHDLSTLLRDARRNAVKIGSATRRDIERLQKDTVGAARAAPKRAKAVRGGKPKARARS